MKEMGSLVLDLALNDGLPDTETGVSENFGKSVQPSQNFVGVFITSKVSPN